MRRWLLPVVVIAAVGGGWLWLETRPLPVVTCRPAIATVREVIAEDGKTRLDREFIISMPISGRVHRISLQEGDYVTSGQIVATIDDFDLRQQLESLQAKLRELRSWIEGVDRAKPKPEEIESARIAIATARLRLESCRREKAMTEINLADAERELRRMEKLLAGGVVQQAQYDEAKRLYDSLRESLAKCEIAEQTASKALEAAQLDYKLLIRSADDNEYRRGVYEAQIEQVRTEIKIVRDKLAKTRIKVPSYGVILEKYVEDEQFLVAGTPLLKIGDLDSIEIETDVLSEEVGRVKPGQKVEISGKALGGRTIIGRVKRIYPGGFKKISALGIEQQRVKVIIEFDNSTANLKPYVSVDVAIVVDERNGVLTVPETAVFKNQGNWTVFVLRNGRLDLQPVEIGLRGGETVEIIKGINKNDIIVAEPNNEMHPGQRARPASEAQ